MEQFLTTPVGSADECDCGSDLAIFIGRFQPFHSGHLKVVREALANSLYLCILVGSATAPRTHRNPFTYDERVRMILGSLSEEERKRVLCMPLEDCLYNDLQWIKNAQDAVLSALIDPRRPWPKDRSFEKARITLVGHSKDASSYYLSLFPEWGNINVPNFQKLSSTPMREAYFSNIVSMWLADCDGHKDGDLDQDHLVPSFVREFLTEFQRTAEYSAIRDEYDFMRAYRAQWASAPYPPTFVTVDAVVVQSGHVLLVKRRERPGKGLWALPGGFLGQGETILEGTIRELREETGIKVPEPVLRGSIVRTSVFDDPHRSARGRTITHATLVSLKPAPSLPKVRGSDDAEKARWVPLSQISRGKLHEDHFDIILNLTAFL